MITVRESLPFIVMEVVVGLLASAYGVTAFYEGRFGVAAIFAVLSVAPYALAVHFWNESAHRAVTAPSAPEATPEDSTPSLVRLSELVTGAGAQWWWHLEMDDGSWSCSPTGVPAPMGASLVISIPTPSPGSPRSVEESSR